MVKLLLPICDGIPIGNLIMSMLDKSSLHLVDTKWLNAVQSEQFRFLDFVFVCLFYQMNKMALSTSTLGKYSNIFKLIKRGTNNGNLTFVQD